MSAREPRGAGDGDGREAQTAGDRAGREAQTAGDRAGREAQTAGDRAGREPRVAGDRAWRAALRRVEVPDAAPAGDRAWRVVGAAFAAREPERRPVLLRRRPARALAGALTVLAAAVAVALTPPGDAVAQWVRDVVAPARRPSPSPTRIGALPAPGKMLVTAASGAWIVERDGSRRRLGAYRGATWSPQARFVAVWRGRQLSAVDQHGHVRWRLTLPAAVHDARWSPDGFLVAFRTGTALWLVAGDGSGAHVLDPDAGAAAPAWRPEAPHVLAWRSLTGAVVVLDAARGTRLGRSAARLPDARALSWSADGTRLVAVAPRRLALFDAEGKLLRDSRLRPGRVAVAAAWAPRGRSLALVEADRRRGTSAVRVLHGIRPGLPGPTVFSATGRFASVDWSPDARWLLTAWPDADQWLALRPRRGARASAIAGIRGTFGGQGFPTLQSWCCS